MTFLAISSIAAGLIFALVLAWFLARPLPQESLATRSEAPDGLLSEHAQHFPQLRHPLAGTDAPYVEHCTSPQIARHWRDDRQQALQNFLSALGEDFARLEQLAALAVAMTPEKTAHRQPVPLSLLLQFRANYRFTSLLLRMRSPASTPRITRLAELLGNLSACTAAHLAKLTCHPASESCAPLSKIPRD